MGEHRHDPDRLRPAVFRDSGGGDRGELAIGGCLWSEESPDRRCKAFGWELNVLTENVT
jgi:hypothetical protein